MLEKLKPLRSTPTGIYFRMADGRIGYANHQYARVSVTREGIRNGMYYKEDCSIGDRMYQINTRTEVAKSWKLAPNEFSRIARVRYNDISEAINALQNFNCKNCGEYAVELRKNKILKEYEEHKALNIRSVLTRDKDEAYNRGHDDGRENGYSDGREFGYSEGYKMGKENGYEDGYNEGFSEGVISVEEKLNKLLNTL